MTYGRTISISLANFHILSIHKSEVKLGQSRRGAWTYSSRTVKLKMLFQGQDVKCQSHHTTY